MIGDGDGKLLRKCRILVAPLDWGLGHTTRCIPVINELLAQGCDVWLAGDRSQETVLKMEFPQLPFLPLAGYGIRYSSTGKGLAVAVISQLMKIASAIRKEHRWLGEIVSLHDFDGIISDNRFGLSHPKARTVLITHQLTIKTALGRWSETLLQKWNYKYINHFNECWVADMAGPENLADEMSHPAHQPRIPLHYVGLLSRFREESLNEVKDHLLFVLSGPEPQRTLFERKVVDEVSHYPGTATIVRGLPAATSIIPSTRMIRFYNHLPAGDLNREMQAANWVISRSGYSTIMDIVKLKKKSILVPTPGQPEQQYLGRYFAQRRWAVVSSQRDFALMRVLKEAERFDYQPFPPANSQDLASVVAAFVKRIESEKNGKNLTRQD